MDSGASFHMTPYRDWFHTYQSYDGIVYMCDNSSCKIVGVREVWIKMFDGSIHIILGVRPVLNLRKSLLSLEKLDEDGCKLSRRNNQLIIIKRALLVAKGKLKDGQYRLIGRLSLVKLGLLVAWQSHWRSIIDVWAWANQD